MLYLNRNKGEFDCNTPYNKNMSDRLLNEFINRITYCPEKFVVKFISNSHVTIKHYWLKQRKTNIQWGLIPFTFSYGEFVLKKNHNGNLSVKYDFNQGALSVIFLLAMIGFALAFTYNIICKPNDAYKILSVLFVFETLIWGAMYIGLKIIPYRLFIKTLKELISTELEREHSYD